MKARFTIKLPKPSNNLNNRHTNVLRHRRKDYDNCFLEFSRNFLRGILEKRINKKWRISSQFVATIERQNRIFIYHSSSIRITPLHACLRSPWPKFMNWNLNWCLVFPPNLAPSEYYLVLILKKVADMNVSTFKEVIDALKHQRE